MSWQNSAWLTERRHGRLGLLWLALMISAALWLALLWASGRFKLQTDLFNLLPDGIYAAEVATAVSRVNDYAADRLFLALQARDAAALEAATALSLRSAAESSLLSATPLGQPAELGRVLYTHRAALQSSQDRAALEQGDFQALTQATLEQLANPFQPVSAQMLSEDPFLLFQRYLLDQAVGVGASSLDQGWPTRVSGGQQVRLLVFTVRGEAFDMSYQERLLPWLAGLRSSLQREHVDVLAAGTALYAATASREAQGEIAIISMGASIGLMALVWWSFRSPRPLLTELLALLSGCLSALLGTHLAFGEVHLLTVLFGASLIGVSVDYSMHYLCAQSAHPERPALQTLRLLLPGLLMGLLTTVAAYACMALAPFPGLQQMALFSALGLTASWLTGVLLLPRLKPLNTSQALAAVRPLTALRRWSGERPFVAPLLLVAAGVVAALLVWQWRSNDNVRDLQHMNPQLLREEANIRALFTEQPSGQFFVVHGADEQLTANREAALLARLDSLVEDGALQTYQALGRWLPDPASQQRSLEALRSIPDHALLAHGEAIGLGAQALRDWRDSLSSARILVASDLGQHPLRWLYLAPGARIVALNGIADYRRLAAIDDLPGVQFTDPVNDLSSSFGRHRQQGMWLVAIATLLLAALLAWRYGVRALPRMLGPVLLSLIVTLLLLLWCGVAPNLFVIMALFLILGIGVDYAIFYRESYAHSAGVTLGVTLCMLSTALGFGLLGISSTPVVRAFGLTVLFGVLSSFLFATLLTRQQMPTEPLQWRSQPPS